MVEKFLTTFFLIFVMVRFLLLETRTRIGYLYKDNLIIITYMLVVLYGRFQFQQSQIVFERRRIVLSMYDDPLHVLTHAPLLF